MQPISEVFNMDCMEGMKAFPNCFFELAIVDPPYGLKQNIIKVKSRCRLANSTISVPFNWDCETPCKGYFNTIKEVSKKYIVFGANYFDHLVGTAFKAPRRNEYKDFIYDNPIGWIIWDKVNGSNDFSDCELALTSFSVPTKVFHFMWAGMMQGKSMLNGSTMQGNKKLNEKRIHPTQKPVALYQWLLKNYAKPGDKILDTHLGSQSSRIAAYKMGFDFWGYETDEQYFIEGNERFLKKIEEPLFKQVQTIQTTLL